MSKLAPIPTPMAQRWLDARLRLIPAVVMIAAVLAIGFLWKDYVAAPTMIGQAEPILANVSSYKPGMLAQLTVTRFQSVKAGDPIGEVLITDPKILASSLAVIQAEIEILRTGMQPIAAQQRNAINYDQLRLDWMKERAQLAGAKVSFQLACDEFHRTEELFKDKIVSEGVFEQARAAQDRLHEQVNELTILVTEQEQNFQQLQGTNRAALSAVSEEPLRAAMSLQDSKLRLAEAEMSPIILRSPVDGTVSSILHRSGEAVNAGDPVVTIAALNSVRIVGYLRPPITQEPKVGMRVQVRTRGLRRETGAAKIVDIGTQLESVTPALMGSAKLTSLELGLPLGISLPPELKIRPGELVDLILLPSRE